MKQALDRFEVEVWRPQRGKIATSSVLAPDAARAAEIALGRALIELRRAAAPRKLGQVPLWTFVYRLVGRDELGEPIWELS